MCQVLLCISSLLIVAQVYISRLDTCASLRTGTSGKTAKFSPHAPMISKGEHRGGFALTCTTDSHTAFHAKTRASDCTRPLITPKSRASDQLQRPASRYCSPIFLLCPGPLPRVTSDLLRSTLSVPNQDQRSLHSDPSNYDSCTRSPESLGTYGFILFYSTRNLVPVLSTIRRPTSDPTCVTNLLVTFFPSSS